MSQKSTRVVMAMIALGAVIGFLYLYGRAIYLTWSAGQPVTFAPEYVYVATALAGLVGGVAAMIFNEKLPDDPSGQPGTGAQRPGNVPSVTPSASGPQAGLTALIGPFDFKNWPDFLSSMSAVYVTAYFLAGVAAIAAWIRASANTPDLVKNLALISIGLFVAIARSFFHVPRE